VKDGVNGFLVPPNNPDALAEAILDLINDPAKRKLMGK
jgi:glycosyltransferase involved in cell wall biosynthesis